MQWFDVARDIRRSVYKQAAKQAVKDVISCHLSKKAPVSDDSDDTYYVNLVVIENEKVIQLRGWDDSIDGVACGVYTSKVFVSLCVMPNDIIQMCIYTASAVFRITGEPYVIPSFMP